MCNCKADIESRLTQQLTGALPASATHIEVNLEGFAALLSDHPSAEYKNQVQMVVTYTDQHPRSGKPVKKREKLALTGNFCMFCGVRYDRAHVPTAG